MYMRQHRSLRTWIDSPLQSPMRRHRTVKRASALNTTTVWGLRTVRSTHVKQADLECAFLQLKKKALKRSKRFGRKVMGADTQLLEMLKFGLAMIGLLLGLILFINIIN